MGWYARWLLVVWGPADQVERFKHAFKSAWRFYPDGDMGAWERVGYNLKLPKWTLQYLFRQSEEADARAEGDEIPPPTEEFLFVRANSSPSSLTTLKQLACKSVANLVTGGDQETIAALSTLPDEVKCEIARFLTIKQFEKLRKVPETSQIFSGFIPDQPAEAQLIYDLSLNKGYLLHDLKQVTQAFPDVTVDVAYWVEPSSSQDHIEVAGGGEMSYMFDGDDNIVYDLSYRHEFYVSPTEGDAAVSPLAGWSEFTEQDCAESYRFRYDEVTPLMP